MARHGRKRGRPALVEPRARRPAATQRASLDAFVYTPDGADEASGLTTARACALAGRKGVSWINVAGADDADTVCTLGEAFGLHPLVVEDIGHAHGRPKLDVYEDYVFVVAPMVSLLPPDTPPGADALPDGAIAARAPGAGWQTEQVSFVLGRDFLLTFQPDETDVFEPIRARLRAGAGRVRQRGADYLLYTLLDLIVDEMFVVLERVGDATEELEGQAVDEPSRGLQRQIAALRRDVSLLRRAVWPLREVIAGLQRDDVTLVAEGTLPFLRDVYDHLVQAMDVLESLRDVLAGVLDLYLSALSTRQNEVMKTLTVVSAVFIPLTFIAGVYGMNFENMPELQTRNGYFILLGVMFVIGAGTLAYFRHRRWI